MPRVLARVPRRERPAIAPFPESAGDQLVVDLPWRLRAAEEGARVGLTLVDVDRGSDLPEQTVAVVDDATIFSGETLAALVEAAREGPVRAAIAPSTTLFARMSPFAPHVASAPPGTALPLALVAGPPGTLTRAHLDDHALPLRAICDELRARRESCAPLGPAPCEIAIPDVVRLGGTLAHWVHVLEANLAFLHTLRRRAGAVGARNVRGAKAKVHGHALVEGSLLGAGSEIEAGASVIDSFIGPGVKIAAHSVVVGSVIGEGCHTLIDTHLRRVVAFPGSTLSNIGTSDALFGRYMFITTGVQFFSGEPGRTVVVEGVDTGRASLSGAVGHKAILGARALFAAGVAVPSGSVIVMRPDEGVTKLDDAGLARASMMRGDPAHDH